MANERAILCGSAPGGELPFDDRDPIRLRLWGPHRNVHLTIEDVRKSMWKDLPATFHDLLDIASYVYTADQAVTRGGTGVDDMGASWRRTLFFRVPVRNHDFWSQPTVQRELVSALSFLSEDEFEFDFVALADGPPLQRKLEFVDDPLTGTIEEVVLFSGGLDSLGGAVQEAVVDRRNVCLVNHRSTEKLAPRHRHLLGLLSSKATDRPPLHIPIRINKQKKLGREYTQRTRSFLYAALGATIASMVGLNRIRFYENGIVSLNLPLSGQVVGARATRTTHPRALRAFEALLSAVTERSFAVENKFLWKTKTDVVRVIADAGCADMVKFSTSCTHTWEITKQHPHCGVCSQCIDRRFAVLAAGQSGHDPTEAYKVDLLTGERPEGDPRTMLAAFVETANEIERMDAQAFFANFGEAFRVLKHVDGTPDAVAMEIFNLHRRHAKQVTGVIDTALASHAAAIRKRELPPTCLLRLVSDASGSTTSAVARSPIGTDGLGDNVFQRKGQVWQVRFAGGTEFILLPSKGAAYLNILLANPRIPISAVDLACRVARNPDRYVLGSAGTNTDAESLKAYAARLTELREELEDAKRDNDIGRQEAIQVDIESLNGELKRGRGLGNRLRKASDDRDRIRKAVGNAIRRSINGIGQYDPRLAEHLKSQALRLGLSPLYSPMEDVAWDT